MSESTGKRRQSGLFDLVLWVLASPVLLIKLLVRTGYRVRFYRVSYTVGIPCRNCHETISLVGMWKCHCGYTYQGHLLRNCPVCGVLPKMARCFACGNTERLPDHI